MDKDILLAHIDQKIRDYTNIMKRIKESDKLLAGFESLFEEDHQAETFQGAIFALRDLKSWIETNTYLSERD